MREDAEQLSVCYLMKDIDLFVQLDEVFIEPRSLRRYSPISLCSSMPGKVIGTSDNKRVLMDGIVAPTAIFRTKSFVDSRLKK